MGVWATMLDFTGHKVSPAINIPAGEDIHVFDFTTEEGRKVIPSGIYSIGKYDENRKGLYEAALFAGTRYIHMGIDIGAPINTEVLSCLDGEIYSATILADAGDYGHAIITKHEVNEVPIWILYGHLSSDSLCNIQVGQKVSSGEVIGWLGGKTENGGWEPHLHIQISLEEPLGGDIPGVVALNERKSALQKYPDPRCLLGDLY
ncbi:MAG: peptidoglycan DD-metalloendopeptidase family protein [Euryarchaeota archaeon]|nr:peptidoglycan DD-metalloendopeptidase family protein [Euryarchaeota archaeon]